MKQEEFNKVMALSHKMAAVVEGETYDKIIKALLALMVFCLQEQPQLKTDTVNSIKSILDELKYTTTSGELH